MKLFLRPARPAGWLLAGFILLNAAGELLWPGFAMDHFWIRSVKLLGPVWRPLAVGLAAALLLPGSLLARSPRLRLAAAALPLGFCMGAAADACWFWALLAAGRIRTPAVVPLSVLVAAVLAASALRIGRAGDGRKKRPRRRFYVDLAAAAAMVPVALLALIFTYGPTDYTRPADCAVVLGSKAYRDGTPSLALYDRTMTAVRLYQRGLVGKLVMSGGVDRYADGLAVSEPEVSRRLALECGVPDADIIVDEEGVNSWATVVNARKIAAGRGWRRVLLVSHYYHLPRLRLAADRAGLGRARTVPCRQTRRLRKEPWGIARECAGLGYYYLFRLPREGTG